VTLLIELGGGINPRGPPWVNVDSLDHSRVDVRLDLDRDPLPWGDDSADGVYSCHALEHLHDHKHVLWEVARVCRPGAAVEFRVPHWLSMMALCLGHTCTVSPQAVDHWTRDHVPHWWAGSPKRLRLGRTEYVPSGWFAEAKSLFPHLTDDQVLRYVPNAAHEVAYFLAVVPNDAP
jgi:SAM-dependent methyltransferase